MSRTTRSSILLLLVLACAAGLRLWRIDAIPPGFHFDEAFEGLEAWRILTDPSYRPIFLTGNFGVPPLNAYANAVSFAVAQAFGGEAGPVAMRTTAALFGLLGVLFLYALGVELHRLDVAYGQLSVWLPVLAAASLAAMRWHIHFSRMGIEPVIVPLVWSAALWLLLLAWRTGRWLAFAGCGVVMAAGMYAYQGAWIVPFLTAAAALHLLFMAWPERRDAPQHWRRRVAGLVLAGGTALMFVLPMAWFFRQQPELLLLRPTQLAVIGETGSPADSSLGGNVWATLRMFAPFGEVGDLDPRRNLPGAPALSLWQAIPFYIGLAIAVWRIRRPVYSISVLGLTGLLLPGVFSEYAPHYHRILGAAAPAALLCGIGLDWLWQRAAGAAKDAGAERWANAGATSLVVVLLVGAVATSTRDYFVRWAGLPDLYYAFDEGLWTLGQLVDDLSEEMPVYITPQDAGHATLAFAWRKRNADALPVSFDGRYVFPLTDGVTAEDEAYVVIEHEDFRTPMLLPEVFPSAGALDELKDRSGDVYARVNVRPSGSGPALPPTVERSVALGDGILLAGYDVLPEELAPGGSLYVRLHWLVDAPPKRNWTVFTHLVEPASGQVLAGHDSVPGAGSLSTARWQSGWRVLDEYEMHLPVDLPAGDYDLYAGLYESTGLRLPAEEAGIRLGSVTVE